MKASISPGDMLIARYTWYTMTDERLDRGSFCTYIGFEYVDKLILHIYLLSSLKSNPISVVTIQHSNDHHGTIDEHIAFMFNRVEA